MPRYRATSDLPLDPVTTLPLIVGHRGAAALAPENTIAGIRLALDAGADAIELDVRRGAAGTLVLAHGRRSASRSATALAEALAFIVAAAPADTGVLLDVKEAGVVTDLVEGIAAAGLGTRTIVCAREPFVLAELGRADPSLRRAWSLKRPRHAQRLPWPRRDLAIIVASALTNGRAELLSIHRSLANAAFVDAVHGVGGEVYVWGLRRAAQAEAMAALGVDALIGDDPRLLRSAVAPGQAAGKELRRRRSRP